MRGVCCILGPRSSCRSRLASVERDFRSIKADDLDLRPIWHRLEDRVRAHVLICVLACYLTWHLRQASLQQMEADVRARFAAQPTVARLVAEDRAADWNRSLWWYADNLRQRGQH